MTLLNEDTAAARTDGIRDGAAVSSLSGRSPNPGLPSLTEHAPVPRTGDDDTSAQLTLEVAA